MNKQIFMSIAMLVFAGVAVAGATGAFFSDTETSTGNTFTAGAIDLTVDSEQHYNGNVCTLEGSSYEWKGEAAYPVPETPCTGSWELTNLDDSVTGHKFFNFSDLKPGDYGENTISIHVETNDAYMCAALVNVGGEDLEATKTEPEDEVDDSYGQTAADSELDEELSFFAWVDEGATSGFGNDTENEGEGDNIFQDGETVLGSAKASELTNVVWSLTDVGNPITASTTAYIGVAWCYGDFDGSHNCSGVNVDNMSQTDSWFTDMAFYVEQSRNNDQFSCDTWTPGQ